MCWLFWYKGAKWLVLLRQQAHCYNILFPFSMILKIEVRNLPYQSWRVKIPKIFGPLTLTRTIQGMMLNICSVLNFTNSSLDFGLFANKANFPFHQPTFLITTSSPILLYLEETSSHPPPPLPPAPPLLRLRDYSPKNTRLQMFLGNTNHWKSQKLSGYSQL